MEKAHSANSSNKTKPPPANNSKKSAEILYDDYVVQIMVKQVIEIVNSKPFLSMLAKTEAASPAEILTPFRANEGIARLNSLKSISQER